MCGFAFAKEWFVDFGLTCQISMATMKLCYSFESREGVDQWTLLSYNIIFFRKLRITSRVHVLGENMSCRQDKEYVQLVLTMVDYDDQVTKEYYIRRIDILPGTILWINLLISD